MSEMELLITIIFSLLLSLAFLGDYEIKKGIESPNPFIMELFIIGIFVIFFAFLAIISPKTEIFGTNPFSAIAYFLAIIFVILFLNLFINRYHESISFMSGMKTSNVVESFIKIRLNTFKGWTFILTSLMILILTLVAWIVKLKFSR